MAGFTMPKKGEGAAMLRDLRDEERPAREEERPMREDQDSPVLTEVRTPASTDARTPVLADLPTDASEDVREEGSTEASTEARPQARKTVRKAGSASTSTHAAKAGSASGGADAQHLLDVVDAALASREPLTGGVKATVDMSPELSTRAKRYLADHRGQNTRQVLIALFDAFLTAKGY